MSKRPKLAYHQRTAANNNNREETSAIVEYEYTRRDHHVPNNVTHVRFHPSVTKIEDYGFYNRGRLEEVVLNEGLSVIGSNAFSHCNSLQSIKLSSTLTAEISIGAFSNCPRLKEIVLNEGLQKIGKGVFINCILQSITLPSTVTEIGSEAFWGCTGLKEVVLNDGLKIGLSAFRVCTSLQSITIPSTVTDIVGHHAFSGCTNLREIVLSDELKRIKEQAFGGCWSLESIALPSTVIEIEQYAFDNCTSLREVVIHNEGIQIGHKAFCNCTSLERFKFPSLFTRLDNIIHADQRDLEAKMDDISAVEWRGGELVIPAVRRQIEDQWGRVKTSAQVDREKLDRIVRLIRYYEIKEATTLFELALWKSRIDQEDISISNADREAYRIEVPGPIKDTILQYL